MVSRIVLIMALSLKVFCDSAGFGRLSPPRGSAGRDCGPSVPEFAENVTVRKFGPVSDLDVMSVVDRGEAARPDVS